VAVRLSDRLGLDADTTSQAYYLCLLFYVGCTADAEIAADLFPDDTAFLRHFAPVMRGSQWEMFGGLVRTLGAGGEGPVAQVVEVVRRLPRAALQQGSHMRAICEVATMLTERLGLPSQVNSMFASLPERWDGKGQPRGTRGEELPLAVRVAHVARDATLQCAVGGPRLAAKVTRDRAGAAFDPAVAEALADGASEVLDVGHDGSVWDDVLEAEPGPVLTLRGDEIDRAVRAMGDFADLSSPFFTGHSAGVARLTEAAAPECGLDSATTIEVRRAAALQDVGRVAVPVRVWQKAGRLTPDDWERVRLHPYQLERMVAHSPYLARLGALAAGHHERLDGSGYHRGATAATLPAATRLLAAADAYQSMTEPRPHRPPLRPAEAAAHLVAEAAAGELDALAVAAVLDAEGHRPPRLERPAGLTDRECEVVALLARGMQTKQIARTLGISPKTADRHIQNAYGKIGVSTRAAATVFAMEHGLTVRAQR
jgi:HD-GYP domain-containing protein (c-di-GMP phosphodiesterase class II)